MGRSAFALVLALALAVRVAPAERKCLLSGSWRSDTSCQMVVSTLNKDNRFSGFYQPGPAAGYPELLTSPLEGSQQDTELVPQPTFSFTVNWKLQDSETAWTSVFLGQCYVDPKGEETLHALWLLREAADSPAEDWKGTRRKRRKRCQHLAQPLLQAVGTCSTSVSHTVFPLGFPSTLQSTHDPI
ncbi:avidin-like isoform X1 [Ammospiza nelsoni]|uniref:avidin-like isoform X1 n=1 Tax=Ammospiza caudacuta TaxID=2857398 RepID=UPI0027387845|nr:avidin-like isoform X1 [Ammospiza caudacuta]XP_059349006.1 avidin-like isoform X1 [Ammospiza nelsoni]